MISLLNRFILIGSLQEIHINLFPSHIRSQMSVKCNGQVITIYQTIIKQWHKEQYNEMLSLMPNLHGDVNGNVIVNNEVYYKMLHNDNTRLFISGNVSSRNESIYFNANTVRLTEMNKDKMTIEMEGLFLSGCRFMSIVNDSPRIFNTLQHGVQDNTIYHVNMSYDVGSIINSDGVVIQTDKSLSLDDIYSTGRTINNDKLSNLLLEWEIINGN